jgi:hypothetical protein
MKKFLVSVRVSTYQTAQTIIYADNAYCAKQLAEAQFGIGKVLNYREID